MTKQEFYEEVKNSNLCPRNFKQMLDLQEKYQNLALATLREFHRVCVKNNIEYQLAFGSLLGAIRDNGIIPWDYDVDVFVDCISRNKLVNALIKDLNSDYHFNSIEHNSETQGMILRIAPAQYSTVHLHVDVFFLAAVSDDDKIAKKESKIIRRCCRIVDAHTVPLFEVNPFVHPRGWLQVVRNKVLYLFFNTAKAEKKYRELTEKYIIDDCSRVINTNCFAGTYYMTSEYLKRKQLFHTSEGDFFIPVEYDKVLKELFGDYMTVPPLRSRINDTVENYRLFKKMENEA